LHNRVNELGVAEPVIQQQGADRVVVQLPGVQDTAKAKDIIGRTATLELRLVDTSNEAIAAASGAGPVPFGTERYTDRDGSPLIVKRQVILTGDSLTDAQPGFDGQTHEPDVNLTVDAKGRAHHEGRLARQHRQAHGDPAVRKRQGEVVTAPVIRGELGSRFQITGRMTRPSRTTPRCCCAPARWPRRWTSSRSAPSARPRRREHHQAFTAAVRLRGDRALHVRVLPAVRRDLDARPRLQSAAAAGGAVDAAGDLVAARPSRRSP